MAPRRASSPHDSRPARSRSSPRALSAKTAVVELVREANSRVYRRSLEDPDVAGMGTTATVALVDEAEGTIAIGHVGDSRAYRLRDDELEQLTADHSLVAELVRTAA